MTRTRSQSHLVLVLRALLLVAFFSNSLDAAKLEQNGSCMFSCPSRDAEVVSNTQTGLPAYRILNKIDGHIYIGSNETLTRLSIKNNQVTTNQITLQTMEPTLVVNCAAQNPSNKETVCWNFIRVAERTSSGQLLVCGTNAFSRLCYVCSASGPITCNAISSSTSALLFVPQQIDVTASASVINDGTSDMLYGGSRRDQDTTFNRYALSSDLNAHNPIEFQLDTVVVGMGFINDGTFVGRPFEYTHDDGREYAFFFYRENALEYTSGEKVYSRIARVCKNDTGGITNTNKFITFIKARLQCSISDSNIPFYYDDIQDVVWDANKKVAYGVFTSPKAGPSTSALCSYRIEDIMNLFDNGYFSKQPGGDVNRQWQEITEASGDDFPLPRPGLCKENRTTDYSPLLFRLVPNYNPDDHTSGSDATRTPPDLPYSDPPILFVDGVRFTSLVVDHDNDCTYFFGATTGTVVRAQKENCSNPDEKFSFVEVRDKGTSGPITGLEFLSKDSIKYLVITTEDRVITMPLNPDCSGETDEDRQVAQYPCCEFSDSACTCCQNGHLVESLYIDCSVTYATTVINICVESDRLNSTITQTDITAFNNDMNSFTCAEHVFCLDSGDGSNSVTCLVTDQHRILLIRKLLFRVRAKPVLTVPSVPNLSAKFKSGRFAVGVSWAEITATDTKDLPFVNDINCTDRGYATSVGVRGGMFGLGPHEVTCSATNSDGCQASKTFTFYVKASPVFIRANESAQIASPNYLRTASSHKQSNVNLTWIIRTENGRRIRIIFHNLDNHNGSVFRAGDGNDSADSATMFFEWKGTGEVPHLISLGDTVWLTFDGAYNNAAGFFLSAFSLPSSGANGDKCAASGVPPSCGMCVGPINNDMTRGPPCSCQAGKMGALCDIECPDLSLSIPDGVEFDANKEPVFVTWDEVTGNQTEIATGIGCASPGYGPGDVTVTGGLFKEGSHTVTCSAFDSNGCEVLERFTFSVNLHDLASTLVPDICQSTDKDINGLLGCSSKIVVTPENANVIAGTVARLARNYTELNSQGITSIADILQDLAAVAKPSTEIASDIVVTVNSILQVDQATFDQIDDKSPSRIVQALESYTTTLQLEANDNFTETQTKVAVLALKLPEDSRRSGVWVATKLDDESLELTENDVVVLPERNASLDTETSIFLPAEALRVGSNGGTVNLSAIIYQNNKLFRSPTLRAAEIPGEFRRSVGSRIISVTVEGVEMKHLPSSVTTEFYPIDSDSKSERVDAYECRSKCVYWDFTLNNGFGDWSNKGCRRQFDHEKKIVCVCDHLTSFAVLVDIYGRSSVALDVISKLICTLSTLAIVGTLITHLAFRRFRSRQPHRILINLCFALLGLYVIFLTGIEAPPCGTWCSIVAVLMHYFTLAAILWMAVEAINLYLLLVRLMTGNVTHFMKKACTAAWGFPLVIVILVLAVDHTQYSDNKHCFLKPGNAFYFGLLLPIGLILLLNFVIFVAVMRQLKRNANKMASQNRRQTTVQRLRNAVGISVLLGLTWIFGLLAIVQTSTFVFQVLFAVFNSAQGLLIFVLFCVRQAEVRQEWRRVIQPVLRRLGLRWNIFAGSQSEPNDIPLSRQSTSGTLTTRVSLGLSSLEVDSEEGEELKIK